MKSITILLVILILPSVLFVPGAVLAAANPIITEMISQVNETNIKDSTVALQNFGTRACPAATGSTAGNKLAATWIYNQLDAIPGLSVAYQGPLNNVMGILPGDSKLYIVGAHYDDLPATGAAPGASDDGVGVAIVLEMARILSQYKFTHTVIFAFWNGEEGGQRGSHPYVTELKTTNANVGFYHNIDSAAYDPTNKFSLDVLYNSKAAAVKDLFTTQNTLYGINFTLTYNKHTCVSDHRPFWEDGNYPATFTHSNGGSTNGHSPLAEKANDFFSPTNVSTAYAKRQCQLTMAVFAESAMVISDVPNKPLTVATNATTNVTSSGATLNGNLSTMGTASSVLVSFEYGETIAYGSTTSDQTMTANGTFSSPISGLTPGTTYHFRAKAVGDGTAYGDDMTFATTTTTTTPPTVTTAAPIAVGNATATLNGNLTDRGTASSVQVSFQWGTTASYGSETTAQSISAIGTFGAGVTGLSANTTYHLRAKALGDGSAVYGEDMTFTTSSLADATAPEISGVTSSGITVSDCTITWTTNEAATSRVQYGLTEEYGSYSYGDSNLVTSHNVALTDLEAGKTYHYQVISRNAANNEAVSPDTTFTTTARSGGEMPTWAWVVIGLAGVGVAGGAAYSTGMKTAKK